MKETILAKGIFKHSVLLLASMVLVAVLLASGVALAKDISCKNGRPSCFGTDRSDTITGSKADNNMFGLAGADVMRGRGGASGASS